MAATVPFHQDEYLSEETLAKARTARVYIEHLYKVQSQNFKERQDRCAPGGGEGGRGQGADGGGGGGGGPAPPHPTPTRRRRRAPLEHAHQPHAPTTPLLPPLPSPSLPPPPRRAKLEQELRSDQLTEEERQRARAELESRERDYTRLQRQRLCIDDFEPLKLIGKGAFGEVRICRDCSTGKLVAVKKLRKSEMVRRGQVRGRGGGGGARPVPSARAWPRLRPALQLRAHNAPPPPRPPAPGGPCARRAQRAGRGAPPLHRQAQLLFPRRGLPLPGDGVPAWGRHDDAADPQGDPARGVGALLPRADGGACEGGVWVWVGGWARACARPHQ